MSHLTSKQEKAAFLLAAGTNGKDVAESVGVTPSTISVWKVNPRFEALINQIKEEALENARDGMRGLCFKAVSQIENLMENSPSDAVRLKACVEVLKMSGLHDKSNFAWGVGHVDAEDIERESSFKEMSKGMSIDVTGS